MDVEDECDVAETVVGDGQSELALPPRLRFPNYLHITRTSACFAVFFDSVCVSNISAEYYLAAVLCCCLGRAEALVEGRHIPAPAPPVSQAAHLASRLKPAQLSLPSHPSPTITLQP